MVGGDIAVGIEAAGTGAVGVVAGMVPVGASTAAALSSAEAAEWSGVIAHGASAGAARTTADACGVAVANGLIALKQAARFSRRPLAPLCPAYNQVVENSNAV